MDRDPASAHEFLERRLALMRELAESLARAQAAVARADAGQMNAQTMQQRRICEELRRLTVEFGAARVSGEASATDLRAQSSPAAALGEAYERWRALKGELAKVEAEVAQLNRNYSALLRRARRTVDIFCRVLANSGITYVPPASEAESAIAARG